MQEYVRKIKEFYILLSSQSNIRDLLNAALQCSFRVTLVKITNWEKCGCVMNVTGSSVMRRLSLLFVATEHVDESADRVTKGITERYAHFVTSC